MRGAKNKIAALLFAVVGTVSLASGTMAMTDIEARVCNDFQSPIILQPSGTTETDDASVHISGTAEPGMTVTIIRNNVSVGATLAAIDGTFGVNIPLLGGDNVLSAVSENACNTVKRSSNVIVHRIVDDGEPETPAPDENEPFVPDEIPERTQLQLGDLLPLDSSIIRVPDSSGYQKPVIIQPKTGEQINGVSVWVSGRAQPRSVLTLYLNGKSIAYVVVSEKGTFGILAALQPGGNTLQVQSEIDGRIATSNVVNVTSVAAKETDIKDTLSDNSFVTEVILPVLAVATLVVGVLWGVQYISGAKR